jgi:DUF4097 and DUF4098 domain-containing protein YvlB
MMKSLGHTRLALSPRRLAGLGLAGVLLVSAPGTPLSAQDVQISVQVAVNREVAREIEHAIDTSLPEVTADMREALRDLTRSLGDVGVAVRAVQGTSGSSRNDQTDRQTRPLTLGAAGSLDLSTFAGNITVTAGTSAPTLEVVRRARGSSSADAQRALDRVSVDVQERSGRVTVRPVYPSGGNSNVEVSYVVTAPAGTTLRAHTLSGNIAITGIHGDVGANTASGSVTLTDVRSVTEAHSTAGNVTVADSQTDQPIEMDSIDGNITLRSVKAPRVRASTISGWVRADSLDCQEALLKTLSGAVEYHGPLTRGGRYELHTQSGTVRFDPVGSTGFDLDARTFNGTVHVDPSLQVHVSGTLRRGLTGTIGDGAATVTIVTFSGDVRIGPR